MSIYYIDESKININGEFVPLNDDPSLNHLKIQPLENEYRLSLGQFNGLFLLKYNLEYIGNYFSNAGKELRIISYAEKTNTCYEKAMILGSWDPLNVIKAFYLEYPEDGSLYAIVVPETGCFLDKNLITKKLDLPEEAFLITAKNLPKNMTFGTCSPFLAPEDLEGKGGRVKKIIFDTETLIMKKHDVTLDDFSFGLDHRLSIQMNYYQCFKMLKQLYGNIIVDEEILTLSFKEKLIRKKGKIRVEYNFNTINYRTAKFINSIHGYGDVSIVNDHVDELDLPEVLTTSNGN